MRLSRVLFVFILFCSFTIKAQDSLSVDGKHLQYDTIGNLNPREFNAERIAELKSDPSFDYLNKIENDSWWTKFKRWILSQYHQFTDWLFGDYKAFEFVAIFLQILPYLLLAGFIALVSWLFIKLNPGRSFLEKQQGPQVFLNEEEHIVQSEDIGELIAAAVKDGDFRLAIRYYYLQLLRQLNQRALIKYEFQKTNSEYLNEIREENLRLQLRKAMRLYDFIWYGNFSLSEPDFHLAQRNFQHLETSIKTIPDE